VERVGPAAQRGPQSYIQALGVIADEAACSPTAEEF
jgi:hypothetical protein